MNLKSFEYYIMALNEEKNIRACIKSIISSGGENITILDGGSNDETEKIAGKCGANFISFPGTSLSYRRGFAIEESKADFVFFVDADQRLINSKIPNEEITYSYRTKEGNKTKSPIFGMCNLEGMLSCCFIKS